MTIDFTTPLKNLNFTSTFISFWNDNLVTRYHQKNNGSYSFFSNARKLPLWNDFQAKENLFNLFDVLHNFYNTEKHTFDYEKTENVSHCSYLSLQIMNILSQDGLSLSSFLNQHYMTNQDKKDDRLYIDPLFELYLHHEEFNDRYISDLLKDKYIEIIHQNKKFSDFSSTNSNILCFSKLLKVIPKEKTSYEWFIKNLNEMCFDEEMNSIDYISLNYESQKIIYDYIHTNFKEHIEENNNYFKNLLPNDIIFSKRLFQTSVTIDMYQFIHQNKLKQNDLDKLCDIATEALNIISTPEFMQIINQDIKISHIDTKKSLSTIEILFSTDNQENLIIFENIYLTLLESVLKVSDQIMVTWNEDYHSGENTLITNMNAQFINKHYLHSKLNNKLDSKTTKIANTKFNL